MVGISGIASCVFVTIYLGTSISACEKGGEWQLAFWTPTGKVVPFCEEGLWQWPMRGFRIGEASNPGPGAMYLYGDEEGDLDLMLNDSIMMATQAVEMIDARNGIDGDGASSETVPHSGLCPSATPYAGPGFEFVPSPGGTLLEPCFGTLAASVNDPIDIDLYGVKPFSGIEGDHVDIFLDGLLERLRKLPNVGAVPTYLYIPKSLGRRFTRQANLLLRWWIRDCDRRQPNLKS